MKVTAELPGQDYLEADSDNTSFLKHIACPSTRALIHEYQAKYGENLKVWPVPKGDSHGDLLLRELLEKVKGTWSPPFQAEEEVCHCRKITAQRIDQCVVMGAKTIAQLKRMSSAATSCGTCEPAVEEILRFRRGN